MIVCPNSPAAIPITGSMHYTQNFNVLSSTPNSGVSPTPWADNRTIPGWWLYRAGNGTAIPGFAGSALTYRTQNPPVTVGSTVGNFYSLGSSNFSDRSLAAVPTTSAGEMSAIAVFQNTTAEPAVLVNVRYNAEIRLNNTTANTTETIFCWYRTAGSEAAALNMTVAAATTAVFPPSVSTAPTSNYISGWNRLTAADYSDTNSGYYYMEVDNPVNATPASSIVVPPGGFLAIRWSNINDQGSDALMGIDDLDMKFVLGNGQLAASFVNVVRSANGTPREPSDDTVDCDMMVTASGQASPLGWQLTSPLISAGSYGVPVHLTGIPYSAFSGADHTAIMHIRDVAAPDRFVKEQLSAPWCRFYNATAGNFVYSDSGTPQDATDDAVSFTVSVDGALTGPAYTATGGTGTAAYGSGMTVGPFTPGSLQNIIFADSLDPACTLSLRVLLPSVIGTAQISGRAGRLLSTPAIGPQPAWTFDSAGRRMTLQGGGQHSDEENVVTSQVLDLSTSGAVSFHADFRAYENSAESNFETQDRFKAELIIDGGTAGMKVVNLIAEDYDTGSGGPATGGSGLNGPPNGWMNGYEGSSGTDVRTGASYPNRLADYDTHRDRDEFNPGLRTGASFIDNSFSLNYIIPASANTVQLKITGVIEGTTTSEWFEVSGITLSTGIGGTQVIGAQYYGAAMEDLTAPSREPEWAIDSSARTMTFSNAGTAADIILSSTIIDLTAKGTVYFSALLRARENDESSNFESSDRFRAELVIDGGTVINLVSPYDTGNGSGGAAGEPNGPANGYLNGYTGVGGGEFPSALLDYDNRRIRDELNSAGVGGGQDLDSKFPLSAVIPAAANSVQLRVYAAGTDATESFVLSEVLFTTSDAKTDTDADGSTDWQEISTGTNPGDPMSVFSLTGIAPHPTLPGAVNATFPTVIGRAYRGYYSSNLRDWIRDDTVELRQGTGHEEAWPFVPAGQKRYFKVLAGRESGDFPAAFKD